MRLPWPNDLGFAVGERPQLMAGGLVLLAHVLAIWVLAISLRTAWPERAGSDIAVTSLVAVRMRKVEMGEGIRVSIAAIIIVVSIVSILFPVQRMLNRLGFSSWWLLLFFVPFGPLVGLWSLAYREWPLMLRQD
jgi:hypothetical protein